MKKSVRLSVILPVYNGEKYLERALDSLVAQTVFEELEVVAINDGSKDASGSILDFYASHYPNIRAFHIPNGGVSNARNVGLDHISGTYIGFLDADDWVDTDHFEKLLRGIECIDAEIAACGFAMETDSGVIVQNDVPIETSGLDGQAAVKAFLLGQIDVHAVTKIYRADLLQSIRFDTSLHYGEDRLFALSALLEAKRIALLNDCYYHYYMNDQSAMQQTVSDRTFENLTVGNKTISLVKQVYPELVPYAQCEEISTKCRILGEIVIQKKTAEYEKQYQHLRKEIKGFNLRTARRYASRKHYITLIIAKISPYLYGKLRSIPYLRFKK